MPCWLLLPQGLLVKYIGSLRTNTAAQTDERVRLTSEAIDGVLAAKMMGGWRLRAALRVYTVMEAFRLIDGILTLSYWLLLVENWLFSWVGVECGGVAAHLLM